MKDSSLLLRPIATSQFCPRDAHEQRIRDRLRGIQHGPDDVRDVKHAWSRAAKALHEADPSGAKLAKLLSSMCLLLALCAGCASAPLKECNLELLKQHHRVELLECLDKYPAVTMEMMQDIARLEQEAGGYR